MAHRAKRIIDLLLVSGAWFHGMVQVGHTEPCLGVAPPCLFQTDRHFGRDAVPAVQQLGQRLTRHAEPLSRGGDREAEWPQTIFLYDFARVRWVVHRLRFQHSLRAVAKFLTRSKAKGTEHHGVGILRADAGHNRLGETLCALCGTLYMT